MKRNFWAAVLCTAAITVISHLPANAQSWNLPGNTVTATSALGATNAGNLRLITRNIERMRIDSNGRVAIGTAIPLNILTVKNAGSLPVAAWIPSGTPLFAGFGENTAGSADFLLAEASVNPTVRPTFFGRRSRGTLGAPLTVAINDQLTSIIGAGYDGTGFRNGAAIDIAADAVPTAGNVPSRISFSTGANDATRVERLRIGSTGNFTFNTAQLAILAASGNVGVGTATPSARLHVNGGKFRLVDGTQAANRILVSDTAGVASWVNPTFWALGGNIGLATNFIGTTNAADFVTRTSNIERMRVTAAGRLGIGTATPTARLDIAGTNSWDLFASDGDFKLGDGVYKLKMGIANAGGGAGDAYISSSNRLYLGTSNNSGRTRTLSVNSDGRVGIGTFTPTARLQVVGDTLPVTALAVNSSYTGLTDVRGISSQSVAAPGYGFGIDATGGYIGGYFTSNATTYTGTGYGVYGIATGTTGTRIGVYGTASGGTDNWGGYFAQKVFATDLRVGGTRGAAGYVASINGKLIATEVRVDLLSAWPDYVFSKDHPLMPLDELEAKINADKHLPGVPAACEMEEKGISLGAMQTKTIEKLEENTLYILQLNNRIKELEKLVEALSKRVQ